MVWASSFLFIKISLRGLSPWEVVFLRLAIGAVTLLLIVGALRLPIRPSLRALHKLAVLSILANVAPYALIALGEESIPSSHAALIIASTPVFTFVFSVRSRHQLYLQRVRVVGIFVGFLGIAVLLNPFASHAHNFALKGYVLTIIAACCYAIYYLLAKGVIESHEGSIVAMSALQLTMGSIITLPILVAIGVPSVRLIPSVTISILLLGVLCTGLAFLLNYHLIRISDPVAASTVNYIQPVAAALLGWIVLRERPSFSFLIALGLVLLAVWLTRGNEQQTSAQHPNDVSTLPRQDV